MLGNVISTHVVVSGFLSSRLSNRMTITKQTIEFPKNGGSSVTAVEKATMLRALYCDSIITAQSMATMIKPCYFDSTVTAQSMATVVKPCYCNSTVTAQSMATVVKPHVIVIAPPQHANSAKTMLL